MPSRLETAFVGALVASRWLMAPLYIGLAGAVILVALEFFRELIHAFVGFADDDGRSITLIVLKLIDLVLVAHLTIIMTYAGLETIRSASAAVSDLPRWMGRLDFSSVKLKVVGAIVAISVVDLLETFLSVQAVDKSEVLWKILILLTFVLSGLLLALMDRLSVAAHSNIEV